MHRRDGTIDARATIFRREDTGFQPAKGNPEVLNQTIERRNEMIDENDARGPMGETKDCIGGMQECTQTINRRGRRRENSAKKGQSRVRRREGACAVLRPRVSHTQSRVLTIEAPVRSSEACLPIKGRSLRLIGVSTRPFDLALGLRVAEEAGLKGGVVRTDGQQAAREPSSVCAARAAGGGSRSRDAGARCRALLRRDFGGAPGAPQASAERKHAICAQRIDDKGKSGVFGDLRQCGSGIWSPRADSWPANPCQKGPSSVRVLSPRFPEGD